jgi:Gram-negative bacterial TonB protein C-terminal
MKKIALITLVLFLGFFSADFSNAQSPAGWIRVTSDNGEFSAEVPAKYDFFYDKDGFIVSANGTSGYLMENVHIFSGFQENTLISFECYKTENDGAKDLFEIDKQKMKTSEENRGTYKVKQIVEKNSEFYLVKQYFRSKNYLYVVTAASRDGETAAIKRFLASVTFNAVIAADKQNKSNFSTLKISQFKVSIKEDKDYKSFKGNSAAKDDPSIKKLLPVSKPRVSYVDEARSGNIQGTIALRTTLNHNGFIPELVVIKSLPGGLVRQSVFAALRMRFLPQEKNGTAETISKMIEYHFQLY